MKSTEQFKLIINEYLIELGKKDELFGESLKKPNKNIDDCIQYIMNAVQKSGFSAFDEDEIFQMAVHYYDEDIIDIGNPIECKVITNRRVPLTDAEIAEAKQKAMNQVVAEEKQRLTKKPVAKKVDDSGSSANVQSSLF